MPWFPMSGLLAAASAGLLIACGDVASPAGPAASGSMRGGILSAPDAVLAATAEPFTVRAPLDPFKINENPGLMIHSRDATDLIIQRLTFAPGAGSWHTHPGPSFIIVASGQIKLQRYSPKSGCTETQVYGPGDGYFESSNEVHRAVIVSTESAVLHVTRIIPQGAAITTPASDPGC